MSLAAGGRVGLAAFDESILEERRVRGDAFDVLDGGGELSLSDELDDVEPIV